jgi:predicted nucleic acid-binding protein
VIVVPDAGPLIYLAGAGHLDLLPQLYDRVVAPRVVFDEIVGVGAGLIGAREVAAAVWLEVEVALPDPVLVRTLDRGEAAAIPLAERLGADLLCDDAAGRAEARRRGISVVGTLGVLLLAKRKGLLPKIRPVMESMVGHL